jgi:protein-ribulosamine 3-kinase
MNWQTVSEQIEAATGQPFKVVSAHVLSGGDINSAFRLQGVDNAYFVKINRADLVSMFEAEFAGLQDLAKTQTVRVPTPVVCGKTAEHSFLVLESLEFGCSNKTSATTAVFWLASG